jgi:preprotein translocase subunit SecF
MLDIVGKRYWFFGLSLLVIIPGMIFLFLFGLPLAIDFTGGSLMEIAFVSGNVPGLEEVRAIYADAGYPDSVVQSSGSDRIIIRSKQMDDVQKAAIIKTISEKFNSDINILRFESVGASIGKEVTRQALYAVGAAALAITLYVTFAFRGVPNAWRYGISAVIAMVHDILVVVGLEAIFGKLLGWETDALFLTALLTVIGFSVHDTIVVFDRIRENTNIYRRVAFEQVVNHSIVQTLVRSINTSMTVMITLLSLAMLGGETTRHFTIILLIGVFSGTYSSIFNAASILVVWENKEWKTWFRRRGETPATV